MSNCSNDEDAVATVWLTYDLSVESYYTLITSTNMHMTTTTKSWHATMANLDMAISANAYTIFNTSKIKVAVDMAIVDAGVAGHVILPGTPVTNLHVATKPLVIHLPDGDQIKATRTWELMVPWLP